MIDQSRQIINSCESVIVSITNSTLVKNYFLFISSFILLIVIIKVLLSITKSKLQQKQLIHNQTTFIPKKLLLILKKHSFDLNKIIIVSSKIKSAYTIGFINTRILFPLEIINKLSPKELESVFLHELYHYNNKHNLYLILAQTFSSILFMIPILTDLNVFLRNLFEMLADQFVLKTQKTNVYIKNALIKTINTNERSFSISFSATSIIDLENRIHNINNRQKSMPKLHTDFSKIIISLLTLVILISSSKFLNSMASAQTSPTSLNANNCHFFECVHSCISQDLMTKNQNQSKQIYQTQNQSSK